MKDKQAGLACRFIGFWRSPSISSATENCSKFSCSFLQVHITHMMRDHIAFWYQYMYTWTLSRCNVSLIPNHIIKTIWCYLSNCWFLSQIRRSGSVCFVPTNAGEIEKNTILHHELTTLNMIRQKYIVKINPLQTSTLVWSPILQQVEKLTHHVACMEAKRLSCLLLYLFESSDPNNCFGQCMSVCWSK